MNLNQLTKIEENRAYVQNNSVTQSPGGTTYYTRRWRPFQGLLAGEMSLLRDRRRICEHSKAEGGLPIRQRAVSVQVLRVIRTHPSAFLSVLAIPCLPNLIFHIRNGGWWIQPKGDSTPLRAKSGVLFLAASALQHWKLGQSWGPLWSAASPTVLELRVENPELIISSWKIFYSGKAASPPKSPNHHHAHRNGPLQLPFDFPKASTFTNTGLSVRKVTV